MREITILKLLMYLGAFVCVGSVGLAVWYAFAGGFVLMLAWGVVAAIWASTYLRARGVIKIEERVNAKSEDLT